MIHNRPQQGAGLGIANIGLEACTPYIEAVEVGQLRHAGAFLIIEGSLVEPNGCQRGFETQNTRARLIDNLKVFDQRFRSMRLVDNPGDPADHVYSTS